MVKQKFLAATSRDTVRSRSLTGKPARMLRSAWTDEWEGADVTRRPADAPAERARGRGPAPHLPRRRRPRDRGPRSWPTTSWARWWDSSTGIRPARQVVLDMMTEYAEVAQRFADQVAEEAGS